MSVDEKKPIHHEPPFRKPVFLPAISRRTDAINALERFWVSDVIYCVVVQEYVSGDCNESNRASSRFTNLFSQNHQKMVSATTWSIFKSRSANDAFGKPEPKALILPHLLMELALHRRAPVRFAFVRAHIRRARGSGWNASTILRVCRCRSEAPSSLWTGLHVGQSTRPMRASSVIHRTSRPMRTKSGTLTCASSLR